MNAGALNEPAPQLAAAVEAVARPCRLQFTGTGEEYFGIWIVNLLLTIVTLGVYSAWAKVRKMRYFYRNTHLDGSVFDYHGDPVAILKGRILAVLLLVAYKLALTLLGAFALVAVLGVIAVLPWLLTQSYRFRLHNSSYRGLRFRFDGPVSQAYLIFGLPMLVALAPGALAAAGLLTGAIGFGLRSGAGAHGGGIAAAVGLFVVMFYAAILAVVPFVVARTQNTVWAGTRVEGVAFSSDVRAGRLIGITLTNLLMIVLSLGLLVPFAVMRLMKYKIESIQVLDADALGRFVAEGGEGRVGAVGEGAVDVMDLDFGL